MKFNIGMEFNYHDLWVGIYWEHTLGKVRRLAIYICIVPMFPIVLTFWRMKRVEEMEKQRQKYTIIDEDREMWAAEAEKLDLLPTEEQPTEYPMDY